MLFFTTHQENGKNDISFCKLEATIKNRRGLLVASASLNLSRNSFKESVLLYNKASSTLKIKFDKLKGVQEKVSIMGVWCG